MDQVSQPAAKKRPPLILIAGGGLAALCVVCAIFGAGMNALGLVPTRTPTLVATETLPATSTVAAEQTSTLPAEPTDTPVPTEETNSDPYTGEMIKRIDAFQAAYDKFTTQHVRMTENPQLLGDLSWKLDMGSALGSLQVAAEDLQNIPGKTDRYEQVDAALKLLGAETITMISNYTKAVDNLDAAYLDQAKDNLSTMNEYMQQATDALSQLKP